MRAYTLLINMISVFVGHCSLGLGTPPTSNSGKLFVPARRSAQPSALAEAAPCHMVNNEIWSSIRSAQPEMDGQTPSRRASVFSGTNCDGQQAASADITKNKPARSCRLYWKC
ncbi:hypothetical protein QBC42DRAFT_248042 [Cladorrhinum samala]|uniref:Secreted protein n=1 Tax=Cladorrhinum samala TaxID=585594 RepID=A0AAV9HZ28_9PEZI|nr:hypothetical protein QBC42DRAFT_248042 [Cladorrhinum samala]